MHEFIAKTDKQLGICLRMLYFDNVKYRIELQMTGNGKVIYVITVDVDDTTWAELEAKYNALRK